MRNSDYLAAFFHVLLPMAFEFDPELVIVSSGYDSGIGDPEGQMNATPEVFAHLTHFLMQLANGKLCVILEGGYHLKSLGESVCMTIKTLLGDPVPQITGEMAPCLSAVESIQNVRAAHKPYWKWLAYEDTSFLQNLSTKSHLLKKANSNTSTEHETKITNSNTVKVERFLELHMKNILFPVPPIKTATTGSEGSEHFLSEHVQLVKEMDKTEIKSLVSGFYADLVEEDKILLSLGSMLAILDKILKKEVCNGIAASPTAALSAAVALRHSVRFGFQRVLCVFVGDMQITPNTEDGKMLIINICEKEQPGKTSCKHYISLNWKEDAEGNDFFSAVLGFILPVAYSYQPNLTVIAVGPNRSLGISGISLLVALLQGLAESRIVAVIEDTEISLLQSVAKALGGASTPPFGIYVPPTQEREKRLKALEEELEKKARQELIDHYSKLSDDAACREQRTLWKIQRHKLETARLKFLLEDQKRIEEMLEKLPDGNCRRKLDIIPYKQCQLALDKNPVEQDSPSQVSFVKPLHSNETVGRKESEPEQECAASADKALPVPEPANNNADEHFRPKATGSESNLQNSEKVCSALYSADSLPESNVNIEDFLPKSQDEQPIAVRMQGSLLDEAFRNINSDLSETLQVSESQPVLREAPEEDSAPLHQQSEYDFNTVLRPSAAWQGHVRVGENVFDVDEIRPRWNIHGHASDANMRVGEYVPQVDTYQPRSSPYGHSSDSHIKSSSYTSEVESRRPRWNIHGHVSEAHIKIGEYASEIETSRPRWNIHGHASEANIKIGEYVSNVAPTRPRWSSHGHASDANIKIGENVSEVVSARPRWNIHGHASQSHIKIGELVSDTEPLKCRSSPFGHASQSSIQIGNWAPSIENDPIPHRKTTLGSSSDSTVQTLLYSEELSPAEGSRKEAKPSQVKEETLPQSHVSDSVTDFPDANIKDDKKENTIEKKQEVIADVVNKDPSPDSSRSLQREEPEKAIPQDTLPQETLSSEANAPTTKEEEGEEEDVWKKEQAYLKALSDQYCIEKYQDSYDLMSEPPVSHLLHHVIPRSYTFPVDPVVQSATDETAVQLSELLSLPVLMKRSITAPLVSHVSLVNKAIVDYYFVELNVEKHFEALRHFLLMEDGEFAQSLSDLLFEKLGSGQTPGELLNPLVLNSILNKALQYSLHGDTQLASNLSFALKYLPEMFKPNAPDALSCLELRYKVDWPLNIVITESCMNKYNKIFSFLLQLKHMVWTLKDVWFHLKRTALVSRASNSVQFRQLQLYKHEMQHFVKVIQGYIANQILHVTWCEFGNKLSSVGNLEEIHRTHAEYLNKAIFRGLLTEKAAPVMNIIHSIFSLILKFRSQLISQSWSFDAGKQMAVHPNFGLMQQSYNTFKYYSHFLFKGCPKMVSKDQKQIFQDELEWLLPNSTGSQNTCGSHLSPYYEIYGCFMDRD
ncbi:PREDICTED: gamma-tubulin complex component 6 isoform X6 [Corvus brachyrhynchos]|nr:PREDICTED: gamma-tubulin complex component 6 isoform X6 [Corvus brachyrhynchos]XP_017601445.1 PREDICTED: gamma-tubulin complex component 6 isoform X6 [Corvus brachyrhynchos]